MEGDTTESPLSLVVPQTGGGMHTAEPKFPPARSNFFPYSSPPLSGSAVSALQCKVKKKYQVKTAWKEDQLCEIATVPPVKKREDGESLLCSSIQSSIQAKRSSSSDEEMVVPQFQVQPFPSLDSSLKVKRNMSGPGERDLMSSGAAEIPRGLGEGSSVENLALSAACDSQNDGSPSKATSASSSRPWAPPKGFWRVARPETLLLNGGGLSPLPPAKEGTPDCGDLPQRKAKMKMSRGHRLTQSKMQRADSLESAFSRCAQWEGSVASPLGGLWRADSWEGVCSPGGSLEERVKRFPEKHGDKVKKASVMMTEEAQYHNSEDMFKGLPPYEQSDWETAIITYESELNYRSMFSAADWTLSPRHEQAKRLLERARLKARNQSPQDEPTNQPAQRDGPEFVPVVGASALQRTVLVTAHEDLLVPPVHLLEVRGRDYNRRTCLRRNGQSPTRVRFEDESEKEAERRYLERVRERGPVEKPPVERLSKSEPIVSVSNFSRGLGVNWGMVDIPLPRLSKKVEDQTLEILVPQEVASRKCEACGSILGPAGALPSKPQLSNTKLQVRTVPRWVTPSQSSHNPQPTVLPGLTFTGGLSLVDSVGGVGEAGETVSAFGKLRRRSRKGESRAETSHGPYARSQNIWAQRRNSKTCSNIEDRSVSASQPVSIGGLTFVIDPPPPLEQTLPTAPTSCAVSGSPSQPMPIKSALKSGSKNRQSGQRVVKLLPSVQYRLIQLDQEGQGGPHLFSLPPEEQLSVNLSHPTQTLSSTSGLSPCIRPSSLRYSSALLTPDLQALEISAAGLIAEEDESLSLMNSCVGGLPPECRSALRGGKADGLRAELLRAEHRKAESQWDDGVSGSRRVVEREGRPRLSLRRFFSAMGLNSVGKLVKGNRSSSMDHLSSPSARHASVSPTPPHKAPAVLQRTPSLQSLHTESPLAQLRKASSAQSLQSPKRRAERSTILGEIPLPYCLPTREIQSEGLEAACGAGPQGRLVQAFPDGTLLLELTRPANEPFGFVISRGKGRPDSGIYVEQVGGNSAENIYTGLLGVGDEILEVNGEKVAGQTLDQVTRLLTRNSTATIRIVPHRWIQH